VLPIPDFFEKTHIQTAAEQWDYNPDVSDLVLQAEKWRSRHHIVPAHDQKSDIRLLGIDLQRDFCFPEGKLFVAGRSGRGAIEDSQRTAEFIYRNMDILTGIQLTLDTHYLYQIFFAPFWITKDGDTLAENTLVAVSEDGRYLINTDSAGTVLSENVRPNPAIVHRLKEYDYEWIYQQVMFYCRKLSEAGKYTLCLWPPHCLLGTQGHALAGVIHEAAMFHSLVRFSALRMFRKGEATLTENYDPAEAEIFERWDGKGTIAPKRNPVFYDELCKADALIILGQAASHCVASMLDGLRNEIMEKSPGLSGKIYIVTDCMSAVTVPAPDGSILTDFTSDAEKALERSADAGMHLVQSTTPIKEWPDIEIG